MYKTKFKICGIKDTKTIDCCINNNVNYFGLIFYSKSPRYIELSQAIKLVNYSKNKPITPVGVFFNEPIVNLKKLLKKLKIQFIQLHGEEDLKYINEIKKEFNVKIIKNIAIKNKNDFKKTYKYINADYILFDYKPLKKELPGGNSKSFDWNLLKNVDVRLPWFLSGGINVENVNEIGNYAIPYGIDISSGVEDEPGEKSLEKINILFKSFYEK